MSVQRGAKRSIRIHLTAALGITLILLLVFGGWGATANLAGAVVSPGVVVVEGSVKRVQHQEGGIIAEIAVREGDRVTSNDLLVRLDDTLTRANLAIITKQIDQLIVRKARLMSERDDLPSLSTPRDMGARVGVNGFSDLIAAEQALLSARREMIISQKQQLVEQIRQIRKEREGLEARRVAKKEELALIEQELAGVQALYDKQLMSFTRVAALRRTKAQLVGEHGQLLAEIARAATRITETELQILQLDKDRRAEVLAELRDVESELAQLSEEQIAALDRLQRVEIRAPRDGIVHQLSVHTIGGVIGAGDTLMFIVPDTETLLIEVKLQPSDIDQVHVGQEAVLRLSAFNQRTTPEISGRIRTIAADLVRSQDTGEVWYTAKIEISPAELSRLRGLTLTPGMPVETFIQTGERTALSYLLKPLSDQITRAMREQ